MGKKKKKRTRLKTSTKEKGTRAHRASTGLVRVKGEGGQKRALWPATCPSTAPAAAPSSPRSEPPSPSPLGPHWRRKTRHRRGLVRACASTHVHAWRLAHPGCTLLCRVCRRVLMRSRGWNSRVEQVPLKEPHMKALIAGWALEAKDKNKMSNKINKMREIRDDTLKREGEKKLELKNHWIYSIKIAMALSSTRF